MLDKPITVAQVLAAREGGPALPPVDHDLTQWEPTSWKEVDNDPRVLARWRQGLAYETETGLLYSRFDLEGNPEWPKGMSLLTKETGRRVQRRSIRLDGFQFTAGEVVFFLHHGHWPFRNKLLRRDDNPLNDCIENLYEGERMMEGVERTKWGYEAYFLNTAGHKRRLGVFATKEEAEYTRRRWDNNELDGLSVMGRPRSPTPGVGRYYDRWQAYAPLPLGKRKFLGVFRTKEEAIAARAKWDKEQAALRGAGSGVDDLV